MRSADILGPTLRYARNPMARRAAGSPQGSERVRSSATMPPSGMSFSKQIREASGGESRWVLRTFASTEARQSTPSSGSTPPSCFPNASI